VLIAQTSYFACIQTELSFSPTLPLYHSQYTTIRAYLWLSLDDGNLLGAQPNQAIIHPVDQPVGGGQLALDWQQFVQAGLVFWRQLLLDGAPSRSI
jgi:hypothetical protein